jgi:hypothetical protein
MIDHLQRRLQLLPHNPPEAKLDKLEQGLQAHEGAVCAPGALAQWAFTPHQGYANHGRLSHGHQASTRRSRGRIFRYRILAKQPTGIRSWHHALDGQGKLPHHPGRRARRLRERRRGVGWTVLQMMPLGRCPTRRFTLKRGRRELRLGAPPVSGPAGETPAPSLPLPRAPGPDQPGPARLIAAASRAAIPLNTPQ